jgi:hypothetical protein
MASDDDDYDRLLFINPRNSFGIITTEGRRALAVVKKGMTVASVAMDGYRIGRAFHTDCTTTRNRRPGKRTIRAAVSAGGGWTGSTLGSAIGTGVGALFGGVGAVPGGIIGGVIGSLGVSFTAEKLVDEFVSSDSEDEDEDKNV